MAQLFICIIRSDSKIRKALLIFMPSFYLIYPKNGFQKTLITNYVMKKITLLSAITLSLLLSSCITRYVKKDHKSYNEIFYSYYASRYGNDLVFIGQKYHYIFKDKLGQINEFAMPAWKEKLGIDVINLSINRDNEVTGSISLKILKPFSELTIKETDYLKSYGFDEKKGSFLIKKITLNGVRYLPRPDSSQDNKDHFTRLYTTKIRYELNSEEEIRKALITPIAMTADGVLIVAGGITIPLLIVAFTK